MNQTVTQHLRKRWWTRPGTANRQGGSARASLSSLAHAEQLLQSLFVMAWMVEARDPYTGGHLWRVAQYSRLLAHAAGLSGGEVARIALGGFLHDLGKVAVPDAILRHPGRLTAAQYEVIKTHPTVGARLLAGHPLAALAQAAVLHHHERSDGAGYPHGLGGEAIPHAARIVALCDAFDAMTTTRPYRHAMPVQEALIIIEEHLGRQFDRDLGERFLALGRDGAFTGIVGHSDQGIPLQECPVCGPTIVVRRHHRRGDAIYCPNCSNEAQVARAGARIRIEATGRKGSPRQLAPEPDMDIIGDLVRASAACLGPAAH